MYKTFVSLALAIFVAVSTIHAAEQRRITGKSLTAVCENVATSPKAATGSSSPPILDIGFDRITPVYAEGEKVVMTVTVRKDIEEKYLYLFNVDSAGETSVLFCSR